MDGVVVGRGQEPAELAGISATAGTGAVVLPAGEAGIGETALLERVLVHARQGGTPTSAGRVLLDDPDRPRTLRFSHEVVRRVCYDALSRTPAPGRRRRCRSLTPVQP